MTKHQQSEPNAQPASLPTATHNGSYAPVCPKCLHAYPDGDDHQCDQPASQPPASEPSGRELPDKTGLWFRKDVGYLIAINSGGEIIGQRVLDGYPGVFTNWQLDKGHWHPAAPAGEREDCDELPPFPQPKVVESYVGIPKAKHGELMARLAELEAELEQWRSTLGHDSVENYLCELTVADGLRKKKLTALESSTAALQAKLDAVAGLLRRISGWDHMDIAADGAYWRAEIAAALAE